MKILYVGKHHQANSNDDEGAITYALRQLGHEVCELKEKDAKDLLMPIQADLLLCNHWDNFEVMSKIDIPKVFWCFDLIDWPDDPTLAVRNQKRIKWAIRMTNTCDLGFMSDGDWVAKDKSGKLHVLRQGADERVIGFGKEQEKTIDILMFGTRNGGTQRQSFVKEVEGTYKLARFKLVERGAYGRDLADLIASSKTVVAPDSPVTDRYWSNRIYVALGFGACMLHPACGDIFNCFKSGREVEYYRDREQLHEMINYLLKAEGSRSFISKAALDRIRLEHIYRHRCEQLINTVKERLGL